MAHELAQLAAIRSDPSLLPSYASLTPEVLERPARRPDAPPRWQRALDAVLDGKCCRRGSAAC